MSPAHPFPFLLEIPPRSQYKVDIKSWNLKLDSLNLNLVFASYWLCDLGSVNFLYFSFLIYNLRIITYYL